MDYNKIKLMLLDASNIIITSHKNVDFDALGSMLGMYYISTYLDKETHILMEDDVISYEVNRAIKLLDKENIKFEKYNEIKDVIDSKTLLIVVDTNSIVRIQNKKVLNIKNILVLDHHIKNDDDEIKGEYKYIDEDRSSAIEIVLELSDNMNIYIPSVAASIMLAGIYIDTNGFMKKTTEKTHYYTSLLYKFGISLNDSRGFLKQNFKEYKVRQELILKAEVKDNIAIVCDDNIYSSVVLAKVCDELITFVDINAAFVIAKIDEETVGISARSIDNLNVEKIMKKFGGGGHENEAACQVKSDVSKIYDKLSSYIKELI